MKFASAALCASQVFAWGLDGDYDHEDFKFKGAFRGKASVWGLDKYDGKHDGKYDDKYNGKYDGKYLDGKYDDKYDDKYGMGNWANRYCQKVCEATPGCRNDPNSHGSYCKFQGHDNRPAVCFGLYRIPKALCLPHEHGVLSRKYCFEPFSKHCNDARLKPVRCDRKPKFDRWGAVVDLELFLEGDDLY